MSAQQQFDLNNPPPFNRFSPSKYVRGEVQVVTSEQIAEIIGFPPNEQQIYAVNLAVNWFRGWQHKFHRQQVFSLAGFAGCGKTTIAMAIAQLCLGAANAGSVRYVAPTGKAASRLRQKGCTGACTIHQFIYRPAGENDDGDPIFVDKGVLDETPHLVVMDEASMVGGYVEADLCARRLPIIALYDPGQVPPVKDKQVFTIDRADICLTEIERNAGNIVKASMFVRQGKRLPVREYDDVSVKPSQIIDDEVFKRFLPENNVVICARNNTRTKANRRARRLLGYKDVLPEIGEKVVATANQHSHGVMNGEQAIVLDYQDLPEGMEDEDWPDMKMVNIRMLSTGFERWVLFNPVSFDSDFERLKAAQKCAGGFDFGYALTVHKSQGSEWEEILVFEESIPGVPYAQLMYTAITRAIKFMMLLRAS